MNHMQIKFIEKFVCCYDELIDVLLSIRFHLQGKVLCILDRC